MVDWPANSSTDWNTSMKAFVDVKAASGWVKFDATGAIVVSDNVASVSRSAVGLFQVVWEKDFASADYVCIVTGEDGIGRVNNMTAEVVNLIFSNSASGANQDPTSGMVLAFGEQV